MAAVVGFLGAKGGVGATTIACHWAVELWRQTKKKVLLVDLDVSSASASFLMDVHSEYTTMEASMNLHRLDASFWSNLVSSTPHRVDVLQRLARCGFTIRSMASAFVMSLGLRGRFTATSWWTSDVSTASPSI